MHTQYELGLKKLAKLKKEYNETNGMIQEIIQPRQLQVLQKASIVGMTMVGAVMHLSVLKMLNPAIVFVEEASEVLEQQVLAALQPGVQHLILIGDHYQLSPSMACHELERWSSAVSHIREMILYATSKYRLRRVLDGVHYELQATDPTEMDIHVIRGHANSMVEKVQEFQDLSV